MTGEGSSISVVVSGADSADVASATTALVAELKKQPDLLNVKSDLAATTPSSTSTWTRTRQSSTARARPSIQAEIHNALVGTKAGTVALAGAPTDVYLQLDGEPDRSIPSA